ncbi:HIT domain-containing protein [Sneathiella sp.]|uniref:HIT domain-containing protein n=1 Tax=Sneathiella sp. TaxID=1964365 RepID=UPI003568B914
MFQLHPQLAKDSFDILPLTLSRVLLINDARYPWIVLVPARPNLVELHDLDEADYQILMTEIRQASTLIADIFDAHKVNVAALGNMVPQLHIHVIARSPNDHAWPAPVWGKGDAVAYGDGDFQQTVGLIRDGFLKS